AVCGGHLKFSAQSGSLPLTCEDDQGNPLGAEDFVIGYTAVYIYDPADRVNNSPVVKGFLFDGQPLTEAAHVPRCVGDCPTHTVQADIDEPKTQEDDPSQDAEHHGEQQWVAFYKTGGTFDHDLRLVQDSVQGYNADHGTVWHVPAEPGPVK